MTDDSIEGEIDSSEVQGQVADTSGKTGVQVDTLFFSGDRFAGSSKSAMVFERRESPIQKQFQSWLKAQNDSLKAIASADSAAFQFFQDSIAQRQFMFSITSKSAPVIVNQPDQAELYQQFLKVRAREDSLRSIKSK